MDPNTEVAEKLDVDQDFPVEETIISLFRKKRGGNDVDNPPN